MLSYRLEPGIGWHSTRASSIPKTCRFLDLGMVEATVPDLDALWQVCWTADHRDDAQRCRVRLHKSKEI